MKSKRLKWDARASKQFDKAIDFIEEDSLSNAKKVAWDIAGAIEKATVYPEFYPPDKYKKKNNKGNYRAFEIHRFRISYYIGKDIIRIVRFRHTSMEPRKY